MVEEPLLDIMLIIVFIVLLYDVGQDFLSDIHGQKLFLTLHNDGKLASFKDSSGK